MKITALTQQHIDLRAKMVPFAGYNMPVQYTGVTEEHFVVREGVGVFDVSHMGEFLVEGANAEAFLQSVVTNDVSKLVPGKAQYNTLPNEKGGLIDDLIVYKIEEEKYLLVVNASNIEKDFKWLESKLIDGVTLTDQSDDYALLAVQGPKAIEAMQVLTQVNLSEIAFYNFTIDTFAGVENVIISATGYTGSGGFEIYIPNKDAVKVWQAVLEAGANYGIKPCGLAARDTLRLEMGYCLYGNDINDDTTPLEAGLSWVTKFTKDFTASDILKKQKEEGVTRKLVAFEMQERGIPRKGYTIVDVDGTEIGEVTSGTMSPCLKKGIGLGYVTKPFSKTTTKIYIQVRKKNILAKVVKLPFYKK